MWLYSSASVLATDAILEPYFQGARHFLDSSGFAHRFYVRDHLGNNRMVIDADGGVRQTEHYYPFGLSFEVRNFDAAATVNRRGFGGKELDRTAGLNLYDQEARLYDPATGRFTRPDPLSPDYAALSHYSFCLNNPLILTDPTGRSTRVRDDGNGTYTIIGGDLNDEDYNIYVYSKDEEGNYTLKGESIGVTTSLTSFYDSDSEAWAVDSKINLQDTSGSEFLENIFSDTPTLDIYIPNATNNSKYDFKGSKDELGNKKNHYRGMSIGKDSKGRTIISSARDIGNIAAGYVSGANGLSWAEARLGFDLYQSYKNREFTTEGMSTQNAQRLGFLLGSQRPELVKMFRKSYGFIKLVNHFKNNCIGLFLQK